MKYNFSMKYDEIRLNYIYIRYKRRGKGKSFGMLDLAFNGSKT